MTFSFLPEHFGYAFGFLRPSTKFWLVDTIGVQQGFLFTFLLSDLAAWKATIKVSVDASVAISTGRLQLSSPTMMIKETSLRQDPDLRGELAFLARGCDFVLPSRFKKRLKSFQQQQVSQFRGLTREL